MVDYPCPGFCSMCFTEVANFKGSKQVSEGIYRPIVISLKPNYRCVQVHLSDGSKMDVSLCETCANLSPDDLSQLIANEVLGWRKEVEHFQLKQTVSDWIDKVEATMSIIDVPALEFDETTKQNLMEVSLGRNIKAVHI